MNQKSSGYLSGDQAVASLKGIGLVYGSTRALDDINLELPASCMIGLIGPDGVGKSSLLALVSGARQIQSGRLEVLGVDMSDKKSRARILPRIAYMPQGLGKNLYPTLSIAENLDFFARLFGHDLKERKRRIEELTEATGLAPFAGRPAGKLSGGMKQKLGLCCALIHDPDLLILDEPTTGVDPLSRRQFWELISRIRNGRPFMSVLVATAYMEEAASFDTLVAMYDGRVLSIGKPGELLGKSGATSLEEAFINLLPEEKRKGHRRVDIPPLRPDGDEEPAIAAKGLTMRFGEFTAVDNVTFRIRRGEIFGFLGSNGCGKTTTMKMLTGLLPPTEGEAWLFGREVDPHDLDTRRRVGYMSQSFSLYTELTVRQNLTLHARLFHVPETEIPLRVEEMASRFGLGMVMGKLPETIPLGVRQRLSLAVAMIHKPEMLILDEPTSGVDPVARDSFWEELGRLSRIDGVTIFISTHFMNEAERCDRISLMHAGLVLEIGAPSELTEKRSAKSLEEAFIDCLEEISDMIPASGQDEIGSDAEDIVALPDSDKKPVSFSSRLKEYFDPGRLMSFARRETLELLRDPVRLTLALLGNVILMLVMGYGITMDVENLSFAVLDMDQTTLSRSYAMNLSGSRYFSERPPLANHDDMDRRMRAGKLGLAIEIPPGFSQDIKRGRPVEIGAWIDGAMPTRAETIRAYVNGMHSYWLALQARENGTDQPAGLVNIETRFRYNPDVKSIVAMVPAVIPLLLMLIPAMLAALAVVREKELGSIINFYVTPATPLEFLLGKQLPYILLSMISFMLLLALAEFQFLVHVKGSYATLISGAFLYVSVATALGLLISTFMRSQIAALFATAVLTLLPAAEYSGIIDPVSSLEGGGKMIGQIYPTTHFVTISRGTFSKALGFNDLTASFIPLLLAFPILIGLSAMLIRQQEK